MQLWELLLRDDQRLDLSKPENALEWLLSRPWGIQGGGDWWTERARSNWIDNILALRSLARRLKKKRLRRPVPGEAGLGEMMADRRLATYVGMLRVGLDYVQTGRIEGLSTRTFKGVVILPSVTQHTGERIAEIPPPANFWRDYLEFFWQVVFQTFVTDSGPAVCKDCGASLGDKTPTGRTKKQQQCGRCRWREWRKKQPQGRMRRKWRTDAKKRK